MAEKYLPVNPDGIPQMLKGLNQWLVWKAKKSEKGKKNDKIPFSIQKNPATGQEELLVATWRNPNSWMDFETALKALKDHKDCKGLQFVLPAQEQVELLKCPCIVGVDFDNVTSESKNCLDHSNLDPTVATFDTEKLQEIRALNTYAELSPSGHGLRALLLGEFPVGEEVHKNNVEVYQYGKILTITGHKLDGVPTSVEPAQDALTQLRNRYFKLITPLIQSEHPKTPVDFTDMEILQKLSDSKIGEKFRSLYYAGELKEYSGDHSSADLALTGMMCFYTQKEDQLDRLFRDSKLFREEKWDRSAGYYYGEQVTYGQRTLRKAIMEIKQVYKGSENREDCDQEESSLYPFSVNDNGIFIEKLRKDPITREIERYKESIAATPCEIVAMGINIDRHNEILFKLKIKTIRGEEKFVWKTTKELLEKTEILKLHNEDMQFKESNANDLIDFFNQHINKSKGKLPVENAVSTGGWKSNFSMYVIGNRAITVNGVLDILPIDNPTADNYTIIGTLENWVKGANYILEFPAVRFKMYNACAATLLRLLHMPSYLVDQHAKTGQLKSDSSEVVASMFGNPLAQQTAGNSTMVGVLGLINYCVDIPTFIDETSQNTEAVRKLAYSVGNVGKRVKGRNDNRNGIVIPSEITTVLEMTGENPVIPENSNGGEDVRILPLAEGVDKILTQDEITDMKTLIEENYGHVIDLYIKELLNLKSQLKDMYKVSFNRLPEVIGISENRVKNSMQLQPLQERYLNGYLIQFVSKQ